MWDGFEIFDKFLAKKFTKYRVFVYQDITYEVNFSFRSNIYDVFKYDRNAQHGEELIGTFFKEEAIVFLAKLFSQKRVFKRFMDTPQYNLPKKNYSAYYEEIW
ncbi:MAG: hypothetical protein ACHQ1D_01425 [Nitrososphaerales archaeon]